MREQSRHILTDGVTEVEIDFGVFADALIEAGVVFKRDYRK